MGKRASWNSPGKLSVQEKDAVAPVTQYRDLKATQPNAYDFSENELVGLGYRLIAMKRFKDAIEIFKLSVEVYPQSYNTYDSLAEAYMDNDAKGRITRPFQTRRVLRTTHVQG